MGTKLLKQEYERNIVQNTSSEIVEGEAIETNRAEMLDDIVMKSDFIPQNTKDHMNKLKLEMSTFSKKSNKYDWKNKSKSGLIPSEEEVKFDSNFEDFFEQEEIQDAWFKEEETQNSATKDTPQVALIGKTGEELRDVVERDLTRKELTDMVKMENNVTRIAQKSYQFKQLNCILAAISSYRHITACLLYTSPSPRDS